MRYELSDFEWTQYMESQIGIAAHPSRRPLGGLLRRRSNLLKHNNLMLRSERRERLEAWAASDSPISHSRYYRVAIRSSSSSTSACRAGGNGLSDNANPRNAQ